MLARLALLVIPLSVTGTACGRPAIIAGAAITMASATYLVASAGGEPGCSDTGQCARELVEAPAAAVGKAALVTGIVSGLALMAAGIATLPSEDVPEAGIVVRRAPAPEAYRSAARAITDARAGMCAAAVARGEQLRERELDLYAQLAADPAYVRCAAE